MNIAQTIAELEKEIAKKKAYIAALHKLAERIPGDITPSIGYETIDFDYPKSRQDVTTLMQQIGARTWKKEINGSDKVDYITSDFDPDIKIRIYGAPPPPSCKIVEFDEPVPPQPATTRKVRKLVCIEPKAEPQPE